MTLTGAGALSSSSSLSAFGSIFSAKSDMVKSVCVSGSIIIYLSTRKLTYLKIFYHHHI